MPLDHAVLEVYQAGELTVVGFGGIDLPDLMDLSKCRDQLVGLLEDYGCQVLAFDLTGVKYIPSGMLGLLASLRRLGIEVHLYNPSADIREVLAVTRLDELLEIHSLELHPAEDPVPSHVPNEVLSLSSGHLV